jgi:Ca2+-binding RTX toxin-like protein
MAIITPSQSVYTFATPAITVATFDDLFVGSGITLASATGFGVQASGSNTVHVYGTVTGGNAMLFLGDSATIIGAGGHVAGDTTGIFYGGDHGGPSIGTVAVLDNAGIIAAETGVYLDGGPARIANTGSIFGAPGLGQVQAAAGTAIYQTAGVFQKTLIENSGLIASTDGVTAINLDGSASDVITNSGMIRGIVDLGDGSDRFDSTDGQFRVQGLQFGIVDGEAGADTLIGSAYQDVLRGGSGTDTLVGLAGDDTMDGGSEADRMSGGTGSDIYFVEDAGDVVDETGGNGIDTVSSSVNFSFADTAHAIGAIENLLLAGAATAANGTGNALANTITGNSFANILDGSGGNDILHGEASTDTSVGGAGNDILDGGTQADHMYGGVGNDVYLVDNGGDVVDETGGNGIDAVQSSVNFSLADAVHAKGAVERLTLTGTAANGTGNALANVLVGNGVGNILSGAAGNDSLYGLAGNDKLVGGLGNDTLVGGLNADVFVFNTTLNAATNRDTITDFNHVDDTMQLENAIFAKLGAAGALNPGFFFAGAAAHDANDHIIYNQATGALFYDVNGNAAGGTIQFATIANHAALAANDFVVI